MTTDTKLRQAAQLATEAARDWYDENPTTDRCDIVTGFRRLAEQIPVVEIRELDKGRR